CYFVEIAGIVVVFDAVRFSYLPEIVLILSGRGVGANPRVVIGLGHVACCVGLGHQRESGELVVEGSIIIVGSATILIAERGGGASGAVGGCDIGDNIHGIGNGVGRAVGETCCRSILDSGGAALRIGDAG